MYNSKIIKLKKPLTAENLSLEQRVNGPSNNRNLSFLSLQPVSVENAFPSQKKPFLFSTELNHFDILVPTFETSQRLAES